MFRGGMLFVVLLSALVSARVRCPDSFLKSDSSASSVSIRIDLTNENQRGIIDSLARQLSTRLKIYGEERSDFELSSMADSSDIIVRVLVSDLNVVSYFEQRKLAQARNQIDSKYAEINDEAERRYDPESARRQAVALKALSVTVAVLTMNPTILAAEYDRGPRYRQPSGRENRAVEKTWRDASFACDVEVVDRNGIVLWDRHYSQNETLKDIIPEKLQLSIFARDLLFDLEGKMPLLKRN